MVKRSRSRAARKGWQTRRANQRRRNLAAKRGWRTRRHNEREAERIEEELEETIEAIEEGIEGEEEEVHIILRKQTPAKKERNGWSRASVEVSITAPANVSNTQIKKIADAIAHQQPLPFGATAEAIEWMVGKRAKTYPYLKDAQSGFARFGLLSWQIKTT